MKWWPEYVFFNLLKLYENSLSKSTNLQQQHQQQQYQKQVSLCKIFFYTIRVSEVFFFHIRHIGEKPEILATFVDLKFTNLISAELNASTDLDHGFNVIFNQATTVCWGPASCCRPSLVMVIHLKLKKGGFKQTDSNTNLSNAYFRVPPLSALL